MQNKHQAGYYNQNVNKEAFNYLKFVLNERSEDPQAQKKQPVDRSEILKKINELDKSGVPEEEEHKSGKAEDHHIAKKKSSTVDPELVRQIEESILDSSPNIKWDDI